MVPQTQAIRKGKKSQNKGQSEKRLIQKSVLYSIFFLSLTFIAFFPSLKNDFMPTWDDNVYVTNNPIIQELSATHVKQMFTRPVNSTYVPIPLLTFAVEYSLFGDNPTPHHVTNLILHLLCTFMVFQFLRLMKLDIVYAAIGALLFGIHPMRVESVAWITERKDVLYGLFYVMAMIYYIRYQTEKAQGKKYLWLTLLFFVLALFSKIEAVSLPLSLLVIDFYLERPLKFNLIIEKIPYFFLSLLFGILGILILLKHGTLQSNEVVSFGNRIFYGLYSFSGYIIKFVFPYPQSAYYPYPLLTGFSAVITYFINPAVLVGLIFLVYRSLRTTRAVLFGALFFLVNVVFLLQIFAAGTAFFSDRFTYIPYIGLIFIAVWFLERSIKANKDRQYMAFTGITIVVIIFMIMTFNRCLVWKDSESLWSDSIEKYPEKNVPGYANLGVFYGNTEQWDKAITNLSKALAIDPKYADAYENRGVASGKIGEQNNAISDFTKAIEINPKFAKAYHNRAVAYSTIGEDKKAIDDLVSTIEIEPKYASAYTNLGLLYFKDKQFDKAIDINLKGIKLQPQNPDLYLITGRSYFEKGDHENAIKEFQRCLLIKMNEVEALLGMAQAFYLKSDRNTAFRYLDQAKSSAPELSNGMNGVASLEKSGMVFTDLNKATLTKMFSELNH